MIVSEASEGYSVGLAKIVEVIGSYADAAAPQYADLLAASANRVKGRLLKAHESQLNALSGKFSKVRELQTLLIGELTHGLDDDQAAAISDLNTH